MNSKPYFDKQTADLKLYLGVDNRSPIDYTSFDLASVLDISGVNHNKKMPFDDSSASRIIVNGLLSKIILANLDNALFEISRVIKRNGELEIHFIDALNLFDKFNKGKISLERINEITYGSKSLIDKSSLIKRLNDKNFDIVGFEFEDKASWDDYNCIIKASSNKKDLVKSTSTTNSYRNEDDMFSGISFDNQSKPIIESDDIYDLDLINALENKDKDLEPIDYDLLAEVMDFELDSNSSKFAEFNTEINSSEKSDEDYSNQEDLFEELMNFSPESESNKANFNQGNKFNDDNTESKAMSSLLEEIKNFSFDEIEKDNILQNNRLSNTPNQYINQISQNYGGYEKGMQKNRVEPSINLVWEGSQFVYNPVALVNREICSGIINSDVANVTLVPFEADDVNFSKYDVPQGLIDNDIRHKKEVSDEVSRLPYAWIRHQNPPKSEPPKGAKWIIMQPCEFSHLRQDIAQTLKRADEVWTPSFYSRKAMIDSGLDFNKVQVIPNGINPEIFKPTGDKYYLSTNKKIKFLFVGGTIYRKGFDVLLKSFTESFSSSDDVCLVVKDTGTDSFYKGINSETEIINAKKRYDAPEIIYIKDNLSERQMASLYRACDIIVAPYRAESFCLPLLEGIACGLPAIATKGGASDDFLEEAYTKFISAEVISIGNQIDGIPLTGNAFMLEPSEDELKDALLYYYSNPGNIVSMGAIASAFARSKWTWNKSVIKVLRRLDYLYGTKMSGSAEKMMSETYDSSMIFGTAEHAYIEGDYDNAVDLYMRAIKGEVPEKYKLLGMHRIAMILINRGEQDAAKDVLKSVNDISWDHPDSRYTDVIINASMHKHTEALELLSPLLDGWKQYKYESNLGHNLDDLLVLTADLMLADDDIESAHSLYTTALSINGSNSYACYGAAMCFKMSGLNDKAQEMFDWAIKLNPGFEDAQKELDLINRRNY